MLATARDFDLHYFSAISSLVLFHGAANREGFDLFRSLALVFFAVCDKLVDQSR